MDNTFENFSAFLTALQRNRKFSTNILSFIEECISGEMPVFVGTLQKKFGLNGFKPAEIGTSVFEVNDRHVIYLESLDGKTIYTVPFYKGDLSVKLNT